MEAAEARTMQIAAKLAPRAQLRFTGAKPVIVLRWIVTMMG
jgi:hypothetical protein